MKVALKVVFVFLFLVLVAITCYAVAMMNVFDISLEKVILNTKRMLTLIMQGEQYKINKKAIYIFYGSLLFPLIITFFVIFLFGFKKKTEDYGRAKFATSKDFKMLDFNSKNGICFGVYEGAFKKEKVKTNLPLSIVVVAPPGAGKSAGVIIPNLLEVPNSCIVLDIKGENEEKTSAYRRKYLNNEILIFNPFAIKIKAEPILNEQGEVVDMKKNVDFAEHSMFFNPFARECVENLSYSEIGQLVGQIVNTIFVSKEDDHWLKTSKELFSFFAKLHICTKGETTFFDIAQAPQNDYFDELQGTYLESVCYEKENQDDPNEKLERDINANTLKAFLLQVANDETYYPPTKLFNGTTKEEFQVIRNEARRWATAGEEEFASIKSTFSTYMMVFCDPRVKEATSKMSFKYHDLRNRRISVFVKVSQTDVDTLGALIRVLMETIAKNLCTGEEVGKQTEKYVYLYLDEFVRFGKMEFILRLPELSRSYGVVPIYISQSYEQFELTYSKEHLGILLSTAHYQLIFRLNSLKDAETLSKTIGNFTRAKESVSAKGLIGGRDSTSKSFEGYALMTPQDIMGIDPNSLIIITSGNKDKPLKVRKNMWFEDKELLERAKLDKEARKEEEDLKKETNDSHTDKNATEGELEREEVITSDRIKDEDLL